MEVEGSGKRRVVVLINDDCDGNSGITQLILIVMLKLIMIVMLILILADAVTLITIFRTIGSLAISWTCASRHKGGQKGETLMKILI